MNRSKAEKVKHCQQYNKKGFNALSEIRENKKKCLEVFFYCFACDLFRYRSVSPPV